VIIMFHWLVDRFLLKDRPAEKHPIILERYLGELPRSIGVAVLASAIVLSIASQNTSKYALIILFAIALFLILGSINWDIDMLKEKDIKWIKNLPKEMKKIERKYKKKK